MRKHLFRHRRATVLSRRCRRSRRPGGAVSASRRDAGFTLTEALIAAALSMVVLSAALSAFNSSMGLADTSRIVSETNHSLQAAMSLMVRDLMQTGQGIPTGGIPIPSGDNSAAVNRPAPTTMTFPSGWQTLPAIMPGSGQGPIILGVTTDVLNLLYADPTIALDQFPLAGINNDGSQATVNVATNIGGAGGISPGDLILFSNPNGSAIQIVTSVAGQTITMSPGDAMNLNQPDAETGNLVALGVGGVYPPTTARRVIMVSYYLDNTTDPTLPRLIRRINAGTSLAIALGVENLQFTFDIVDGASNPINVDEPPTGNSAHQIRKARLFLAARSLDQSPVTHQHMRNSMATDVGLRSLSYVDRYK
jgi:type II secretory pathway pseudopilin PulG